MKGNLRKLTIKEKEEFWNSLLKEGKPMTFYAKKYNVSPLEIDRAYNEKLEVFKKDKK